MPLLILNCMIESSPILFFVDQEINYSGVLLDCLMLVKVT